MDGRQDVGMTGPRDAAMERRLRDEVLPGHAEYLRSPGDAVPVEDVLARIKARRAAEKDR